MSALTDVAKQAMEYFCDRGSVDTYSEEWGFYLALRDALAQEPNPQMRKKSLGTENNAGMDALRDAAQQALEALEAAVAGAVAAEREACAKVCEDEAEKWEGDDGPISTEARLCALAIRARGTP